MRPLDYMEPVGVALRVDSSPKQRGLYAYFPLGTYVSCKPY